MRQQITAEVQDDGQRLDRVVRRHVPSFSRAATIAAIDAGVVKLNGRCGRKGALVRAGDVLELELAATVGNARVGADPSLALRVLYEDAWLVMIDKPAGVPSGASRAAVAQLGGDTRRRARKILLDVRFVRDLHQRLRISRSPFTRISAISRDTSSWSEMSRMWTTSSTSLS